MRSTFDSPDHEVHDDDTRVRLSKTDRPRAIDRYIDFFGAETKQADDTCGERLLEVLEDDRESA